MNWIKIFFVINVLNCNYSFGQDSLVVNNRLKPLMITGASAYTASLITLDKLWYSDFKKGSFHFFDDSREWKQVDKAGHFYSAFQISNLSYKGLKWSGVRNKKAIFWGAITSVLVMTPIEIFDGYSAEYGASASDILSNTLGGLFFVSQHKLWNDIRIHPKYSYKRSNYAQIRPNTLGNGLQEEFLKDYNAQTYWLSVDLSKFYNKIPKWLNVAIGYGADNMIYANDSQNHANGFLVHRQYYLAIDFDFNEYQTKSKFVNSLIYILNLIKLPAPTIELKDNKFKIYSFYY